MLAGSRSWGAEHVAVEPVSIGLETPCLSFSPSIPEHLEPVLFGFSLDAFIHNDAVEKPCQACGHVDRTVNGRAMLAEFALGMVRAVQDITLDDPPLGVAVNQVPEGKRASQFQLRLALQEPGKPSLDIDVVAPNPHHLLGAAFVYGFGSQTCHRLVQERKMARETLGRAVRK